MRYLILLFATIAFSSCNNSYEFHANFDNVHDRVWIGQEFWSIPLEEWKIENGKLHCLGNNPNSRVNLLTHSISPATGNLTASVKVNLINKGDLPGSAGFFIGVNDYEDTKVQAACYYGKGIPAGVSLLGFAFLDKEKTKLPDNFDFEEFTIIVEGNNKTLKMIIEDRNNTPVQTLSCDVDGIHGLLALANNLILGGHEKPGNSSFSFDNLKLSGTKIIKEPDNSFGPVLWTMYTLNNSSLNLIALLPPIGQNDNQLVSLQLKKENNWRTIDTQTIEPNSRTAVFKLDNWDNTENQEYRVEYIETRKDGSEIPSYFDGEIRKDPVNRPLKLGSLTCQHASGFPYTPLINNLTKLDPDILFFSGDQIYEANGGYPIKREPEDISILNYLGKYYMFGWAFRDLMRNRPTICTPDDHDVYQGNIWGEGGEPMEKGAREGTVRGFIQSPKMINVVNLTQCGNLPAPHDPTPIKQGISVWYTNLTYGRVSFAIISDRVFKSGPEQVAIWEGRNDHLTEKLENMSILNKPGLKMIGERQLKFLEEWIMDWKDADMKVLLSQTVYANVATDHGNDGRLLGDLDSGGWPKSGRDEIIRLIRKASVFHINGDQHLPTMVQYGLDDYRDAGWSFCPPAISTGYQRWFLPDELDYTVNDRPKHNYPNTGRYADGFGNKNYVYAVGNPSKIPFSNESRYNRAMLKASGFGIVTFDQINRDITIDSWRFIANVENPNPVRDQFPGWPFSLTQFDNLGLGAENILPTINISEPNQVLQVWNEKNNEIELVCRIKGTTVQPRLNQSGSYTLVVGEDQDIKKITGIKSQLHKNEQIITVKL